AGMLQCPGQLDKVEQYCRRKARKKASVEARSKAAIQTQLDRVRTGLSQLHNALNDVKDIQQPLADVSQDWRQSINTTESLRDVKDAMVQHSQLSAAVQNLKNIFSVPEIVRKTEDLIEQGELLQAHWKLMDLEWLLQKHAAPLRGAGKQLWMVLQQSLVTVCRDPTLLVSVILIIEWEEKIDRRPKKWKEKMFATLDRTVTTRIEGTQADTRMWLVCHLEIIRKNLLDDLLVVKNLKVQCFSPHYDILRNLPDMYHQALSTRMQDLASEDLEANKIVSLLTWLNTYTSVEMMGNLELALEVDTEAQGPLLSPHVVSELLGTYMSTLTSNIIAWLRKALDWVKEAEPEADQDGYYQTTLPAIVFQMFEQNLQVAAQISEDLKKKVLVLCLQQVNSFLNRYKEETQLYKEEHLRNRKHPHCYVQYMMAIINNCQTFKEFIVSLKKKKEGMSVSQPSMDVVLDTIAKEGCSSLLEEVFLDLEQHLNQLMTKKWLLGSSPVDIICVTMEDYFNDFAKIKKPYKKWVAAEAHLHMLVEYLQAIMQKREERKEGAERMVKEAEQFRFLFQKLASGFGEDVDGHCDTIVATAEVVKLTDPSLLYLEVSTLVTKYPDIGDEHIGALLAVPGDASRDMKQTIIKMLGQGPTQTNPNMCPSSRRSLCQAGPEAAPGLNAARPRGEAS
uniref:Exocyst complex component 3 n=1 Tax=Loxodonta africana TaxID=9785 RepID=G3UFA9_LOXAF